MTTSSSYTYEATRNKIIEGALRIVGGIGQGDTPTTAQYDEAAEALNMIVKALAAKGMPLWAVQQVTIPLVEGQADYDFGSLFATLKPLKIIQAWNRNLTTKVDVPMRILTRYDYNLLGNKTSQGNPIQLMHDLSGPIADPTINTVFLFPTPDATSAANNTVFIVFQRQFQDFTSGTETPDFPQEWHEALKYQLAAAMAFEYGMPPNDRKDLLLMAKMVLDEALSFSTEEGSLFFQPDTRNY